VNPVGSIVGESLLKVGLGGGGVLPIRYYMKMLCPKGVSYLGPGMGKESLFQAGGMGKECLYLSFISIAKGLSFRATGI